MMMINFKLIENFNPSPCRRWLFSCPYEAVLALGALLVAPIVIASLAIYNIVKNNKISKQNIPKIVVENGKIKLLLTREEYEYIKANKQNSKNGNPVEDEYRIDFINQEGKKCYITGKFSDREKLVDNVRSRINSLAVEDASGVYSEIKEESDQLKALNLDTETSDNKTFSIKYIPGSFVLAQAAEQVGSQQQL